MKRIRWAFVLLALVASVTLYSSWLVSHATNRICADLDQVLALCDHHDYPQAYTAALELEARFYSLEPQLALFLPRDALACAAEALAGVPAYTHENAELDLLNETEKARSQVRALKKLFFGIF